MTGSAASKKQPIFEQLSLANIFVLHWRDDPAGDPDAPTTLGRDLTPGVVGDSGKFPVVGFSPTSLPDATQHLAGPMKFSSSIAYSSTTRIQ